ncbi:3-phosphoshikimate 1-carboxyvinyltransferase [Candidatus Binatia bacterium]|nr:3-phosphoshikimate 1-carboxyvinyltransferase [Candidatus Binatia bacterium]
MSTDVRVIVPLQRAPDCEVRVPGSKSITNRAVLLAALAEGESTLDGVLFSDDTRFMLDAWHRLGIAVAVTEGAERCCVRGCGGAVPAATADLFVGNAGTAMRFIVAALCLGHGRFRVDGSARMRERPIQDLLDALGQLGGRARSESGGGTPPVLVEADGLLGGNARIVGSRSSQFLSAVLMVAPYARHGVRIAVEGSLVTPPYVDMTVAMMAAFGVHVERDGYRSFAVPPQRYCGRAYRIEPDASSAQYFLAAAALTGGRVRVPGLGRDSLQGDVTFADVLERMGARVVRGDDFVEVRGGAALTGIEVDMNAISDTAPTLAAIAPFARSPVIIRNIAHARLQESDRLHAVATELRRLGGRVAERPDGLVIEPSEVRGGTVETYDDHRIAMSFALIGLRVPGIAIREPGCVAKTFPGYFDCLEGLRR